MKEKHKQNSHPIVHFLTSEGVSEMSEWANEWAVRVNERLDERVTQYSNLYSWLFWPTPTTPTSHLSYFCLRRCTLAGIRLPVPSPSSPSYALHKKKAHWHRFCNQWSVPFPSFVCKFYYKKISTLGSLDKAESVKRQFFLDTQHYVIPTHREESTIIVLLFKRCPSIIVQGEDP